MRPVIFVVDSDTDAVRLLRGVLEAQNFAVRTFATARDVLGQVVPPQLFLLERTLPDQDGLKLCSRISRSPLWAGLPIIFVTEKSSEEDRVAGLRVADDYIIKPFSPLELVARLRAVLRRARPRQTSSRLRAGDLELDADTLTVHIHGRTIGMTAMEFRLLAYLALNSEKTFTRDELLGAVWNSAFVTPRTVDVHVRRLREKIEPQPEAPRYLQTIRGRGYRLIPAFVPPIPVPSLQQIVLPAESQAF